MDGFLVKALSSTALICAVVVLVILSIVFKVSEYDCNKYGKLTGLETVQMFDNFDCMVKTPDMGWQTQRNYELRQLFRN